MKPLRCAVYTRKSTEDGLEQEFNSLDAQREACEAYILSQRHEGWSLVQAHYDDGGFSGGNMERPGLKALLADIDAGLVDVIVVYKVDRLTRSLADFAKIVEQLDAKHASFVSVTQAFNTTTSMGRLRTLIASVAFGASNLRISINLVALGSIGEAPLELTLPERKPFREAKLRIDTTAATDQIDHKLVSLIAEAMEVRKLVLASPELSLNQIGKREGRCRTRLGKLFRLSWLSPRIIEAIIDGRQPARLDRRHLLEADLPVCWHAQERMLGFAG